MLADLALALSAKWRISASSVIGRHRGAELLSGRGARRPGAEADVSSRSVHGAGRAAAEAAVEHQHAQRHVAQQRAGSVVSKAPSQR